MGKDTEDDDASVRLTKKKLQESIYSVSSFVQKLRR